jgi:hypothetical protein
MQWVAQLEISNRRRFFRPAILGVFMSEELPRLTDPSEFEDLIVSLLPLLINDVTVGSCQRVAISGYKQFGIDIYCPQSKIAVQCKNTRNFSKKTLSRLLKFEPIAAEFP